MGKENNVLNSYLDNPSRFADLFNAVCFHGEKIINPGELTDAPEKYDVHLAERAEDNVRSGREERIRDIKKIYNNGMVLRVLAVENQSYVDYASGVRNMQYDALEYTEQLGRLKAAHKSKGDYRTPDERLSGILKSDRLHPVYTLWLYHGEEKWDGPRTLKDMMDFGEKADGMEVMFHDYEMNLICLNELEDYSLFRTELGQLFEIMKYRRDRRGLENLLKDNEKYRHLDADTVEAMSVVLHRPGIWKDRDKYMNKNEDEREEYDMCQALQEICDERESIGFSKGMKRGMEQGIEKGIEKGMEQGMEKSIINSIKTIMETMNLTEDKAMDALRIPENKKDYYRTLIG